MSDIMQEDPGAGAAFTRCACARWGAGVLECRQRLDRETLAFAFWVCDGTGEERQRLLQVLLSPTDRERLGLEIQRTWSSPDELSYVVGATLVGAHGPRMARLAAGVAAILQEVADRQTDHNDCSLARSLERTRSLFGLDPEELELCFFFTASSWWQEANRFFEGHLDCERSQGRHHLTAALGFGPQVMARVLGGKLARIGIIDFRRDWIGIEDDFKAFFVDPCQAPVTQELFRVLPAADLGTNDLGLDPAQVAHLRDLFTAPGAAPLHVLLYGPPGTGKSTLARALVRELGLAGLDVLGLKDSRGSSRRAALAVCLEMAGGDPAQVVVVDEADSLLGTGTPWFRSGEVMNKGWLNGVLEQRGLRAIWIVNSTEGIDPAVKRRFVHSLEMLPLDESRRAVMLEAALRRHGIKRHFAAEGIAGLAHEFALNPAVFETAVEAACRLKASPARCREALRRSLLAKSQLLGVAPRPPRTAEELGFMEDGVHTDLDFAALTSRVLEYHKRWKTGGRSDHLPPLGLLFHGEPGTGKTRTARHLAERMGRPVVSLRASDLLDPYVGVTEQKIAAAFARAAAEGAVLVLDEVDTFLTARRDDSRTYEVSRVNELLTQIENHRGLFVCTTNRLDCLDPAALRRFPLKVRFDYLGGNQTVRLYERLFSGVVRAPLPGDLADRMRGLGAVTCADLVLVRRNLKLRGPHEGAPTHAGIVQEIAREVALKPVLDTGRVIGF